jgi:hypothetical protein
MGIGCFIVNAAQYGKQNDALRNSNFNKNFISKMFEVYDVIRKPLILAYKGHITHIEDITNIRNSVSIINGNFQTGSIADDIKDEKV